MEDIISQIIKIDQQAGEKIALLNKSKEEFRLEFEDKLDKTIAQLEKKTNERIEAFSKTEMEFIESQKKELDTNLALRIKKLDQTFEFNHDEIERNIFKSIIKPSVKEL